ncbi:D-isomer specific 2-hydroxyacid dehydrogenase family protein [Jongsikchunia kroppenstedtii]|uniref:D-isomer specific 2-hydroxyacid dehydrogenase family protein n=1 Tax=Jongsikchunia kroppenstedtii TaxID=1121721 RepID=UPI00036B3955|nr:D-isomer specific 2-hydroxyacid dehydrogenase family protein [Jongsikchunia kroppenstedtii]
MVELAVCLAPDTPDEVPVLADAITGTGARLVPLEQARALVWTGMLDGFPNPLPDNIEWVQLKLAGIESFLDAGLIDDRRVWSNASGFYAANVAEHALGMLIAGLHQFVPSARHGWAKAAIDPAVRQLHGSTVTIVGAGGIGRELIPRLAACGARVLAVNRSGSPVTGAAETVPVTELDSVWARTDHVVIAAPSNAGTRHLIGESVFRALPRHAWIVNVARGPLVDQDALVDALQAGEIAGAALDVTDPEPLPDDHPLWQFDNVLITPHVANPASTLLATMAPFVAENIRRFVAGETLLAQRDPHLDY